MKEISLSSSFMGGNIPGTLSLLSAFLQRSLVLTANEELEFQFYS